MYLMYRYCHQSPAELPDRAQSTMASILLERGILQYRLPTGAKATALVLAVFVGVNAKMLNVVRVVRAVHCRLGHIKYM